MVGLAFLAALVGGIFSLALLRQFWSRRRPYQAAWAAALAMFALAAVFETLGAAAGWSDLTYKGYYLFGGLLNVAWLAVGTLYLLLPARVGRAVAVTMLAVSVAALILVLASSTEPSLLRAAVPPRGALTGPAVALAPLLNILGSAVLIGGAAYSAWLAHRRQAATPRVLGTALIAAGAFVVAAGHSYAQARGAYVVQPAAEAFGIAVMFAGYLAVEARRRPLVHPTAN